MTLFTSSRERTRFIRFAIVGTVGAGVDFGVFNLLIWAFGLLPVIASVFSFIAAVLSNFTWNRYWTYPDSRSKPLAGQLAQFAVVNLIGLLIRTPIFAVLETALGNLFASLNVKEPLSAEFLGHNLALAVAIVVVLFWNFFANRYWTFGDVD